MGESHEEPGLMRKQDGSLKCKTNEVFMMI